MTSVKELLETCFSPVGFTTILLAAGFLICINRRQSQLGFRLILSGTGLYLIFLLTPISEVMYANLEHPYPPMIMPETTAKSVVVLSAYGEDLPFLPITSKLSLDTISRMTEGIRLYREIPKSKLVLSGGILRDQDPPIATLMAQFARAMGVPAEDIVLEQTSTTTFENIVEVKKIVGSEPFILVTSSGEMRRAAAVAKKLGMTAFPAPVGLWAARYYRPGMSLGQWGWKIMEDFGFPGTNRLAYLQRAYHEYLGYAWYKALGRV